MARSLIIALAFIALQSSISMAADENLPRWKRLVTFCAGLLGVQGKNEIDVREERLNPREPGDATVLRARMALVKALTEEQRGEKIVWQEDKTEPQEFDNGDVVIETTKFRLFPSKVTVTTIVTINPLALDSRFQILGAVVDTQVQIGN